MDDLSNSSTAISEIIDCIKKMQSYASGICIIKHELTQEEFEQLVREENLMLENYKNATFK
ncbi:MAG: hypothetical protein OEV42_13875 [Deltaproteobacteria bacterium]|nr:hypothetical protein [Deltaproteobacteria bacterium]